MDKSTCVLCDTFVSRSLARKKYQGYSYKCFVHTFPDSDIIRNHKTKSGQ